MSDTNSGDLQVGDVQVIGAEDTTKKEPVNQPEPPKEEGAKEGDLVNPSPEKEEVKEEKT